MCLQELESWGRHVGVSAVLDHGLGELFFHIVGIFVCGRFMGIVYDVWTRGLLHQWISVAGPHFVVLPMIVVFVWIFMGLMIRFSGSYQIRVHWNANQNWKFEWDLFLRILGHMTWCKHCGELNTTNSIILVILNCNQQWGWFTWDAAGRWKIWLSIARWWKFSSVKGYWIYYVGM